MADVTTAVLVPCALSAFALTEKCCDATNNYKICPITQPNYVNLRLHLNLLENDVLDHIDVRSASPANLNSRVTDLGSGQLRESRLGVYVHWTIPRFYRTGISSAGGAVVDSSQNDPATQAERKRQQGFPARSGAAPTAGAKADMSAPDFRPVPNRWLITRRLDMASIGAAGTDYPQNLAINPFEAWVVESDALASIDEVSQEYGLDFDLEVERSPFLSTATMAPDDTAILDSQAETFIGKKTKANDWSADIADVGPSVDLNVMASSNPLFVDFTHHNMNVFTILDNFEYSATFNGKPTKVYLKKAKADYNVIGWHSDVGDDPFTTSPDPNNPNKPVPKQSERLSDLRMQLKDLPLDSELWPPGIKTWMDSSSPARVLCHASMYDVVFDRSTFPGVVLADGAGQIMQKKQPISVGATPIDALLAFCQAHKDASEDKMHDVYQDLLQIQLLLQMQEDDDIDGLQAAADESYEQSFEKVDGGTKWYFKQQSSPNDPPVEASTTQIKDLQTLNSIQAIVDNMSRESSKKQWYLFASWWNYVSGFIEDAKADSYRKNITDWVSRLNIINTWKAGWDAETSTLINGLSAPTKGASDRFFQRKDPTLLFGNLNRGWDDDFADILNVRLQSQTVTDNPGKYESVINGWETSSTIFGDLVKILPVELQQGAASLLAEFRELNSSNSANTMAVDSPRLIPWFHDELNRLDPTGVIDPATGKTRTSTVSQGRDRWQNTQPWRPLYLEWEATYYHIPFEYWNLKEYDRFSNWGAKVVHYGVDVDLTDPKYNIEDVRNVSGRTFLTPQTSSLLKTALAQVFQNTSKDDLRNKYNMPEDEQAKLLNAVSGLEIVSAPMTGLTSNLLTMCEGSHLKPLVRLPNQSALPIKAAEDAIAPVLLDPSDPSRRTFIIQPGDLLAKMDTETTLTPYGAIAVNTNAPPMKPVTHGQMMFTKLNVIDKFGQVVCAIDPSPRRAAAAIPTVTPCLSDAFFPGTIGDTDPKLTTSRANVVIPQIDNAACPLISLPPSINQPARLNAAFLVKDRGTGNWRESTDWDLDPGPIIGWMVVNYANQGLQFFFPDGNFYREVRLGGRHQTSSGFKFLPFDPPTQLSGTAVELDKILNLLGQLDDPSYLRGFFDMINQSIGDNQAAAPDSYATYSSAIVGKPLAIVNAGWSLELASEESLNWSTYWQDYLDKLVTSELPVPTPARSLLGPKNQQKTPGDLSSYTFPIKIGDKDRSFDGLVGYFLPKDPTNETSTEVDYKHLYTYFVDTLNSSTISNDPRIEISPSNYRQFTPFWIPPSDPESPIPSHDARFQALTLIMDPFLPVHAYSAILPNKSLKLPEYLVERALKRITAFFNVGPLLSSLDLSPNLVGTPTIPKAVPLDGTYADTISPTAVTPLPTVLLPLTPPSAMQGGGSAEYRFLQPLYVDNELWKDGMPVENKKVTKFFANAIDANAAMGSEAAEAKLAKGPYTALEGYIQVVKSAGVDS